MRSLFFPSFHRTACLSFEIPHYVCCLLKTRPNTYCIRSANDEHPVLKVGKHYPSQLLTLPCAARYSSVEEPCSLLVSGTSLTVSRPNFVQYRLFFTLSRTVLYTSSTGFSGNDDTGDENVKEEQTVDDSNNDQKVKDANSSDLSAEIGDNPHERAPVEGVKPHHQSSRIMKIIIPATNLIPDISRAGTSKKIPPKEYPLHAAQHLQLKSGPLGNDEKWKDGWKNDNSMNKKSKIMSNSKTRTLDHSTRFDVIAPIELLILPSNTAFVSEASRRKLSSTTKTRKNGKGKAIGFGECVGESLTSQDDFISLGSQSDVKKVTTFLGNEKKNNVPKQDLFLGSDVHTSPQDDQSIRKSDSSLSRFGETVKGFLSFLRDPSAERKEPNESEIEPETSVADSVVLDNVNSYTQELEDLVQAALSRVGNASHHRYPIDSSAIQRLSTIRDFTAEFYQFCGYEVHCRVVSNLALCRAREGKYEEAVNLLEIGVLPLLMTEDERIKHNSTNDNNDSVDNNKIKNKALFLQCALAWFKAGTGDYRGAVEVFDSAHKQLQSILAGPSSRAASGLFAGKCDESMNFFSRCAASVRAARAVGGYVGLSPQGKTLPLQYAFGMEALQQLRVDKFYLSYARLMYNIREYRVAGVILQELILKKRGLVMCLPPSPNDNQTGGDPLKGVSLKRDEETDGGSPFSSEITELECYMMYGKSMRHIGEVDEAIAAFDHCIQLQSHRRQTFDHEMAQQEKRSKKRKLSSGGITADHIAPYLRLYGGDRVLTAQPSDINASPLVLELCFPEYEKAKCLQYSNSEYRAASSLLSMVKKVPLDASINGEEEVSIVDDSVSEEIGTDSGDGKSTGTDQSSDENINAFPLVCRAEAVEAFEATSEVFVGAIEGIRSVLSKVSVNSPSQQANEQGGNSNGIGDNGAYTKDHALTDILCEQLCVILEMYGHVLYDSALCYESHPDYGPHASVGVFEECLRILEETGLTHLTARIRLNYGHCLLLVQQSDKAIEQYAESLRILLQQDTSTDVVTPPAPQISEDGKCSYLDLGEVHAHIAHCYHYYIGVYDMAERHYAQALEDYGGIDINGFTAEDILKDTNMRADIVAWALEGRAALRMRLHDYIGAVKLLGARTRLGAHYKDHCVTSFLRLAISLENLAMSCDQNDGGSLHLRESSEGKSDLFEVLGAIKTDLEKGELNGKKKKLLLEGAKGAFDMLLSIPSDEIDPIQRYELCKRYANLADIYLEDYELARDLYAAALSLVDTNPHTYIYYATCLTKVPGGYNPEEVGKIYEKAVAVLELHRLKIEESKKHKNLKSKKDGVKGNATNNSNINEETDNENEDSKELTEFLEAIQPHPYGSWDAPFIFGECAVFNHAQQELSVAHEYYKMALQCCGKLEYLLEAAEEHYKSNLQTSRGEVGANSDNPDTEDENNAVRAVMEAYPLPTIINAARIRVNYAIFLYDSLNTSDGVEELFHEALSLTHSNNFDFLHAYLSYLVSFRGDHANATKLLAAMVIEFPTKTKEMAHLVAICMSAVQPEEITKITDTFIQAMGGESMLDGKEQDELRKRHAAAEADRIGLVRSEIEDIIRTGKTKEPPLSQKKEKVKTSSPSTSYEEANYFEDQVLDCLNSVQDTDVAVDYLTFLSQKTLNYSFADTCFRLVTERFPDNVVLRLHYSSFLAEKIGARDRAKGHLLTALYYQPNNAVILCKLGQFIAQHYPERGIEADKVFRHAIVLHPNDETVALSYALFLSGAISPARERGDEDDEVSAHVENRLLEDGCDETGSSYGTVGNYSDSNDYIDHGVFSSFSFSPQMALKQFQRALEIKPKDAMCHAYFGTFLEQCGKIKMATQDRLRADALFSSAYKHLLNAVSLGPNTASTHLMMGAYLCNQSRNREAWTYFQKSLELEPQNTQNLLTCSVFLIDWYGALSDYQKDFGIDSGEGSDNQHREELKQVANAASVCLSSAVRTDPYNIVLLETYARFQEEVLGDPIGAADVHRAIAFVVQQTLDEAKRSRRSKGDSDDSK